MDAEQTSQIRVSDAEREAVVERLNAATGEGRLTLEEFGERAGQAYAARTQQELGHLVEDLPAVGASMPPAPRASGLPPNSQRVPLGALKRSGRWRLDRDTEFTTVVGSVKLDLAEAQIAGSEVELRVQTVVGSVKVWVPQGIRVEVTGSSTVGTRLVQEDEGYPGAPLLRLHIDTVVGSVKVFRV